MNTIGGKYVHASHNAANSAYNAINLKIAKTQYQKEGTGTILIRLCLQVNVL